jgi:hypothetical protein
VVTCGGVDTLDGRDCVFDARAVVPEDTLDIGGLVAGHFDVDLVRVLAWGETFQRKNE